MTLQKQLLLFTLVLCFFLFAGVWVYKLQSTRGFLEDQLEVHAQDTATSLALSISPLVAAEDLAAVETMMNAIFDRGYYRENVFSGMGGDVISRRTQEITVDQVPGWFIDMIPLNSPTGESQAACTGPVQPSRNTATGTHQVCLGRRAVIVEPPYSNIPSY